ncbi:MAG: dockerin type I domain-containing protein [Pirellulales bacterium]
MSHRNRTRRPSSSTQPRRSLLKSLASLFGGSDRKQELKSALRTRPRRSGLESLESRNLMAVVNAGVAANNGIVDTFELVQTPGMPGNVDVYVNGGFTGTLVAPTEIQVLGSNDDDILTVNSTNGLIDLPGGIRFFGGSGQDGLVLTQTGGPERELERVEPGSNPGQGTSIISDGAADQIVYFEGLEPIQSNVPAASFTIAAFPAAASILQSNNAINYSAHPLNNTFGRVTIDSFEPIDFQNKGTLVIDAGAGDDVINIANPNTPTGLTGITVNGGSPGASDTLIVEAIPGSNNDNVRVRPTAQGAGFVDADAFNLPTVSYGAIEEIRLVLQFNEDDWFAIDGTTGNDLFQAYLTTTAGAASFGGLFDQDNSTGNGPFTLPNIVVTGDNPNFGQAGFYNFFGFGGSDELRVQGTSSDELFNISDFAGLSNITHSIGNTPLNQLVFTDANGLFSTTAVTVDMGAGSDQVTVVPELSFTNVLGTFPVALTLQGGGSDDRLLIDESARTGAAEPRTYNVLALSGNNQDHNGNITGQDGVGDFTLGLVYEGIEQVQLVGDGDDTLSVRDDGGDSVWSLSAGPTVVLESGRVGIDSRSPIDFESFQRVELENTGGVDTFVVSPDRLPAFSVAGNQNSPPAEYQVIGGNTAGELRDTLVIDGTGRDDVQQVVLTSTAITLGRTVGFTDVAALEINTGNGDDSLEVDTTGGFVSPNISYNGGAGADSLLISGAGVADEVQYYAGPVDYTGRVVYEDNADAQLMQIDFANLEPVLDNIVAATLSVFGTGANNSIRYTAGPGGLFFGLGVDTGLVQVDAFESIEFTNKGTLAISGGNGDDVIEIANDAIPQGLVNPIQVDGGGPSASDTLIVNGQAGVFDPMVLEPTAVGAGTVAYNLANLPDVAFTGIEGLTLVGQEADLDAFGVDGTIGDDLLQYRSGLTPDTGLVTGSLDANNATGNGPFTLVPTTFKGMSQALGLQFNNFAQVGGDDSFVFHGTSSGDEMLVSPIGAGDLAILSAANGQFNALVSAFNLVAATVETGDGDDQVTVNGGIDVPLTVNGNSPAPGDTLTFVGTGAGDVTVDAAAGTIQEAGFAAVTISGLSNVIVDAAGQNVIVLGTIGNDAATYQPLSNDSGRLTDLLIDTTLTVQDVDVLTIDGVAGNDSLRVLGTAGIDIFPVISDTQVGIVGLLGVTLANIGAGDAINVDGGEGDDIYSVPTGNLADVNIEDSGVSGNDTLQMTDVNFNIVAGASTNSGRVNTTDFSGVEALQLDAGAAVGAATVNGTSGADAVTVTGTAGGANVATSFGPAITLVNFAANSVLTVATGAGTDTIQANQAANWVFGTVNVDGGDPWAADSIAVRGTANDEQFTYTGLSENSGTVGLTSGTTTTYNLVNVSSVDLDAEGAAGDTLNVTNTNAQIQHGFTPGSGTVNTFSAGGAVLLGVRYSDFETAIVTATTIVVDGTAGDDQITVSSTGIVTVTNTLGFNNSVDASAATRLVLNTLGGNDRVTIVPSALFAGGIDVIGGEPGAGSDAVTIESPNAMALALFLSSTPDVLLGAVTGPVSLNGVETLNVTSSVNGNLDNLVVFSYGDSSDLGTINYNPGDFDNNDGDTLVVVGSANSTASSFRPLSPTSATLTNANGPQINVSNFNNAVNTLTMVSGPSEEITFHGSASNDSITLNGGRVTLTPMAGPPAWVTLNYAGQSSLVIAAGAGDDDINVTAATISAVKVDGGDPIQFSDTLNITAGANTVSFMAGPESDEGAIQVGAQEPISFDHIEGITITGDGTGSANVIGTNADNDITVTGNGANDFAVSIDGGPAVQYTDFAAGFINGMGGDDDIDIDVEVLTTTALTVNGGSPSSGGGDSVSITGLTGAGNDNATYTPDATGSGGTFDIAGLVTPIQINTVENLYYSGENANEQLTVIGSAAQDFFVHTPGAAVDAGTVSNHNGLAIQYTNLGLAGSVRIDGQGSPDLVTARGTNGDDQFIVDAGTGTVNLSTVQGFHIPLLRVDAAGEFLAIDALDGNDLIILNANQPYATMVVLGGSPGGSDTLLVNDVAGAADAIAITPNLTRTNGVVGVNALVANYQGIEHVILQGSGDAGDAFSVNNLNLGDDTWNVSAGSNGDLIQIDDRESIEYTGFDTVALNNLNLSTDLFRVAPTSLTGFNTSFSINGDGNDKVELLGTNNPDAMAQTAANQFTVNGVAIDFNFVTTLQLTGGDGADTVTADLATLAGGVVNLIVAGDGPSASGGVAGDVLNLNVAGNARVTQSTDAGSGTVDQAGAITVNYTTLEALNITSNTAASTLFVRGTNGADNISVAAVAGNNDQVRVWINDGTVITGNQIGAANFSIADVQGRFGDDHFSVAPVVNVALIIEGNDPTASDTTVVNVTADTIFAPTSSSAATLTVTGFAPINLVTMEGVTIGGGDAGVNLTVRTPVGVHTTTLTPGNTADSGDVQVESLMPMSFTNLGAGSLVLDDVESAAINDLAADDQFVYLGTDNDDFLLIDSTTGLVLLNAQIQVFAGDGQFLAVRGGNGSDVINQIGGDAYLLVDIEGDNPDDGDSLSMLTPTGAITINLENSSIVGFNGALGATFYRGLQDVNISALGQTLTVRATSSSDTLEVTPTGADAGFVQNNDEDPVVSYTGVAANTLFVDLSTGDDKLIVHGSAAANDITADVPAGTVTVDGAIVDFNVGAPNKLEINAHEEADSITVVTGAISVFVDGGSPVGVPTGDLLILTLTAAGNVTADQGPEADEGAFRVDANAPLSYDHIEAAAVNGVVGSTLLVNGTNADDDITLIGNGADDFTVSVNAGPAVQYNNFAAASLDGQSGDDDFDIDVNDLAATAITVLGSLPNASGDAVTITGEAGAADNAEYTPTDVNGGTFEVAGLVGANAIVLVGVESLAYQGEDEDETLTVNGTADDDIIVHTPGAAIDSGSVSVNNLLPISYTAIGAAGTVAIDGQAGDDEVVARGTNGDDDFDVEATTGTVVLDTVLGVHVALTRVDAAGEFLTLDGLDGNDTFTLNADQPYGSVTSLGGSPGGSDLLVINDVIGADDNFLVFPDAQRTNGTVIVNAWFANYAGIEHLQLDASGDADTLAIFDDGADNAWDVSASGFGDLVQIDNRESIEYDNFDTVTLLNFFGSDVFTVHPTDLSGFNTSFTVAGDGDDKLNLVGTNNADAFTHTAAAEYTVNGVAIDFAGVTTLQLTGLQNTDTFSADLSLLAGGVNNLVVDGGEPSANNDVVNLTVAANARITQSVDPQSGTVDNAGAVVVNYAALESLNIVSNTAGSTLLIRGTNNGDQIAIQGVAGNPNQGRVWIGAGTVMTLNGANANFANLTVQGRFGDDHFSVSPIANVTVNVEGNDPTASDTVVVNVISDTTFAPLTSSSATVTAVGFLPVNLTTVEGVTIGGNDANLNLTVQTPAGAATTTLTPGTTPDSGSIQVDSLVPMNFTNLGVAGSLILADADANDTFVYVGTEVDDDFTVGGTGLVNLNNQITVDPTQAIALVLKGLNGFDVFSIVGNLLYDIIDIEGDGPSDGDTLTAVAPVGPAIVDWNAAQVLGFGATINYTGLLAIAVDAGNALVEVRGTVFDDDITVTPEDATTGWVSDNWVFTPDVFYFGTGGAAIHIDAQAGQDTVSVVGNALSQTFDIDIPAGSVRIDDLNDAVNDGIVTWENNESLAVNGLEGDDTFNVIAGLIPLFVDGGDPIGETAGDKFNMLAGGGPVIFEAGPENDEGGIIIGTNARISYDHIEAGVVTDAECIIIMGTNGDDDITIIARTELQNPLRYATADGNKDFTSTVNDGIEILWVNNNALDPTVDLFVDGLSGDDDIVFRAPALDPNNGNAPIAWNVQAWVTGGSPSTVTGDQGDVFELGTPGQNRVTYTPTGYSTGVIQLDSTNGGVFDTTINLVESFVCDCDANGVNEYASSDGGFEQFNYDGEGTDDIFTVIDTVNNDVITHTPGARRDEGSVRVNDLLAVNYENLGLNATFTIGDGGGRADVLVALGTGGSDTLTASRESAAIGLIDVNSQISIRTDNIENYTLDGLEGNDLFEFRSLLADAVETVNTEGGGPGGSDVLEVFGVVGAADIIEVRPGETRTDGAVDVNGVLVNYTGVEHLQLQAGFDAGDALTVRATPDLGDNLWTVNASDYGGDRVQIDDRETIDYKQFDTVALTNEFGTDHFRVYPTSLSGYLTSLTITGDAFGANPIDDVLELIGTPANDTVTSNGDTVTINGEPVTAGANLIEIQVNTLSGDDQITLALNLPNVRKVVDAGEGNDNVDVSAMQDATIFGGLGDDTIVGSPIADLIYGGSGNDTISGLGGIDTIYGGEGNDIITGGTGNDNLFGGDGSDRFIWNNGDNSDIVEGDEGVDVQIVNGAAAGDAFLLRTKTGDESRAFFERTNLVPFTIDMGKVEQVDINGGAGADTVEVRDLFTTDITNVNISAGVDVDVDTVTVQGRSVSDNVTLSYYAAVNGVNIAGMKYDVNVTALDPIGDPDTLTFNGNDGDDTIIASDALSNLFGAAFASVNRLIVNGGDGDDSITGFGNLNGDDGDDFLSGGSFGQLITGGEGDDTIYGGGGDDTLNGNAGEDTFVGGAGNDTIDGGDVAGIIEWDTILVSGTTGNDTIDINQTSATSVTHRVNADTQTDTLVTTALPVAGTRTVDEIRVEAGAGADLIRVRIADALAVDAPVNHLVTVVHGGTATSAGDRLIMVDDAADDLTLYRKGQTVTEGGVTIGPGNAEPFETAFDDIERVQFLDENGVAINQDPAGATSRLVMFETDLHEYNDDRFLSTILGAPLTTSIGGTVDPGQILNPFGDGIDIPGDEDWFKVQANVTGTLDFTALFEEVGNIVSSGRPGLPGDGDLDIYVYDIDGTLIAGNGPLWGGNNGSGANPEFDVDGDVFAENERIRIPAVQGQTYIVRVIGRAPANNPTALTGTINAFTLNVINTAAAVPFDLELRDNPVNGTTNPPGQNDNSDTGRNQFDNHTYDNTPTIIFRLDDGLFLNDMPGNDTATLPPDEIISIPFQPGVGVNGTQPTNPGYAIAIFDEGATAPAAGNAGNVNIRVPLGFATQLESGLYTFTVPAGMNLSDGSHFITARVLMIDPANPQQFGWGARSDSFEIVVDRVAPPTFFGYTNLADTQHGLSASSDSGVNGYPATNVDRVTYDTTPTFYGTAEANAIVRLYVESNGVAGLQSRESGAANPDLFIGLSPSNPLDGSNQFPNGNWEITSQLDLNNPNLGGFFTQDGLRIIYATGEDLAGNITPDGNADRLNIFLDTRGPQVTRVDVNTRNNAAYNIWDHKARPDGGNDGYLVPTPLVNSLVISVQDLPARSNVDPNFLYDALFTPVSIDPGLYTLRGDHNGIIPIQSITFSADPAGNGLVATGFVTVTFYEPLPDDRFTLTLSDLITDRVGNRLDGEANTQEPHDNQTTLPSGDGVPGGNFVARFTVDSRAEIGAWGGEAAWVDTNGNFTFDPENPDFVNRDIQYKMEWVNPGNGQKEDKIYTSDNVFVGKFTPAGAIGGSDGFDKLAAYGRQAGGFRWLVDTNNDGVADVRVFDPAGINGTPVAGNFDGNAANGDEVGVFDGASWWLDTNHDYLVDTQIVSPIRGHAIVGDFDGDGQDDLGTWQQDQFRFDFAAGGFGAQDATINFGFIGVRERPVAADMDGDGIDDIGLWVPDSTTPGSSSFAEWYFLVSDFPTPAERAAALGNAGLLNHAFTPVPFGRDLYASYGDSFSIPMVGNFDPPPTTTGGSDGSGNPITVELDVNRDGVVTPLDALIIVNALNGANGENPLAATAALNQYPDVDKSGSIAPLDALYVINQLNGASGEAEGEATSALVVAPLSVSPASSGSTGAASASSSESAAPASATAAAIAQLVEDEEEGSNLLDALVVGQDENDEDAIDSIFSQF